MSKEKWSDAKTKSFISSYIKQAPLWNVSDPDYAIRSKKEKAYRSLQEEFGLTLIEVKNKIRIYRTTYGQELKKMESSNNIPKLTWFKEMHKAFNQGKIKSFTKSTVRKPRPSKRNKEKMIEIEYQEIVGNETSEEECENGDFDIKNVEKHDKEDRHLIIEPYEGEYDEEEYCDELDAKPTVKTSVNANNLSSSSAQESMSTFKGNGMLSNELFLKSLQATLDRLPDEKNMQARIKIQEVLYKITYETEK